MKSAAELLKYAETCALAPRQRVRSRRHPELTGRIKCLEWIAPGVLSAIPYNVTWDDSGRAYDVLGMFALYASDHGIEPEDGDGVLSRCPRCEGYWATYHTFEGECSYADNDDAVFTEHPADEIAARRRSQEANSHSDPDPA